MTLEVSFTVLGNVRSGEVMWGGGEGRKEKRAGVSSPPPR